MQSDTLLQKALDEALEALASDNAPKRLAASIAKKEIRRKVFDDLPTEEILIQGIDPVQVTMASPYSGLLQRINNLLADKDLDGLIALVPIRETSLRTKVAKALKFNSFLDYQAFVQTRLASNSVLADALRNQVGNLPTSR
jgi:hypothetical protein